MAVELVEIVNPTTGRKGLVAATSRAAAAYKQPPSARTPKPNEAPGPAEQTVDTTPPQAPEKPGKNGSKDEWVAYATDPATPNGLSSEAADQMNRDALVAHFETVQED